MLPDPELLRFARLGHRTRRYLLVAKNLRDVRQRLSGTKNNMGSRNQRT